MSSHSERSTRLSEVSTRTPQSRSPSASATATDSRTESLWKSTSTVTFISREKRSANARAAATVSPPYAAISACGTVPTPRPPHHDACASVETPIAPATRAAQPSPVRTSQRSWRAGKKRGGVGGQERVVGAGGKEEDGLAGRGPHDRRHVAHDERSAGQAPEVHRLQMREQRVVALDRHHGLERRDLVALVQRVDGQLVPPVLPRAVGPAPSGALLEDREGLVDPAEDRLLLLEDLHEHARVAVLGEEELAREVEVLVGVVAVADPVDRKAEDGGFQALLNDAHGVIL